ncbi:MAG: hypothetical protein IKP47_10350 [Ruminococcus sp.]|nr:hypothetical protein [Ruminococcus sp.]
MVRIRRRMTSFVTAMALVLSLFPVIPKALVRAAALDTYLLYVAGTQVTSANKDDILGDGKQAAVYEPETKTLVLNGSITSEKAPAVENHIDGLTLKINNEITVYSLASEIISTNNADMTITGGKMTAMTLDGYDGIAVNGGSLTFVDAEAFVSADHGIIGSGSSKLMIRNSYFAASCGIAAITGFSGGIEFEDCELYPSDSGYVAKKDKTFSVYRPKKGSETEDPVAETVRIEYDKDVKYDLWVLGKQVTSRNRKDILGKGKHEASYYPSTNTLELNGSIVTDPENNITGDAIVNSIEGLTIKANKRLDIYAPYEGNALVCNKTTTLTSNGLLAVLADEYNTAILLNNCTLWIKDAEMWIWGKYGIQGKNGSDSLVIRNSDVEVISEYGYAVGAFGNGIDLGSENYVITPKKYQKNDLGQDGHHSFFICNEDGSIAKQVVIKRPYDLWVCGVQVTAENEENVIGDTSVWFNRDMKTLWIESPTFSKKGSSFIRNVNCDGLTVIFNEDAKYTVTGGGNAAIETDVNMKITGGCLTIKGDSPTSEGIRVGNGAKLTVSQAEIAMSGVEYGLHGNENSSLIIDRSDLDISAPHGAVCDFSGGLTLTGCYIKEPVDYRISESYGTICSFDGSLPLTADNVVIRVQTLRKGDVNSDGHVDVTDLTILARSLAKWTGYAAQVNEANADVDGDGEVTVTDYSILARALARWPGYAEEHNIELG